MRCEAARCRLRHHGDDNAETVTDAAPVVSTTSANSVPSAGGMVTISGLSFNTAGASATASLTMAQECGSSSWTSATTVTCAPQAYSGTAMVRTAVSVSAVGGTLSGQFSFDGTCACMSEAAVGETEMRVSLAQIGFRIVVLWLY